MFRYEILSLVITAKRPAVAIATMFAVATLSVWPDLAVAQGAEAVPESGDLSRLIRFGTDAEQRAAITAARAAARTKAMDLAARQAALRSYIEGPLDTRDSAAAEREIQDMQRKGLKVRVEDEIAVARAAGKLEAMVPKLSALAKDWATNYTATKLLGDVLYDLGERNAALNAYTSALQTKPNAPEDWNLYSKLGACDRLLDLGQVDVVAKRLPVYAEVAKTKGYTSSLTHIGELYERLGDFTAAEQVYLRTEQLSNSEGGQAAGVFRNLRRSFQTGAFDRFLSVSAVTSQIVPIRRQDVACFKVQALAELSKVTEAGKAAGEVPWVNPTATNPHYLIRYIKLCRALKANEQLRSAADHLQELVRRETAATKYYRPNNDVPVELMLAYRELGAADQAKQWAEYVLRSTADTLLPEEQWRRAKAQQVLGQTEAATASLAKAQRLDPANYWYKKDSQTNAVLPVTAGR